MGAVASPVGRTPLTTLLSPSRLSLRQLGNLARVACCRQCCRWAAITRSDDKS